MGIIQVESKSDAQARFTEAINAQEAQKGRLADMIGKEEDGAETLNLMADHGKVLDKYVVLSATGVRRRVKVSLGKRNLTFFI